MQQLFYEDLSVGQSAEITNHVTEATIIAFAEVSGDHNPVHLDEAYAAATPFGGRIAHGMLAASYISAVLGTTLPGPGAIYMSQQMRFLRPIRIGDTVVAKCTVKAMDDVKNRVTFETQCLVNGKPVVDGEAIIMVSRKSA